MAKIRRIIRKTKQPTEAAFDEQFWPVMLALFVLGGFLVGTVLAYLRFDERQWYANAWTWLFVIPIVLCLLIGVLRKVKSRAVRRGVQFSAVLCIIVHLILFIVSIETNIFGRIWAQFTELADVRLEREPLVEPIYDPVQFESQPDQQQDLLRPVETETPETELEELQQERQPEPPTERQPTPTPEREITVKPNEIQRPTPAETVPRQAEQLSQLSRQTAKTQPQPNQPVEQPQPASQQTPQPSAVASQDSQLQRQATETPANRPMTAPDATAQAEQPRIERARPTEQATPQTTTAAVPTMPRTHATPQAIPQTQVASNVPPSAARQTLPQEMAPSNTTARQQATASPQADPVATQPTPSPVADVQAISQRREQQAVPQPSLAQTPTPVANQRTRATSRPDVATIAAEVAPSPAPSAQANPTVNATSSAVARTQTTSQAQTQANMAEPATPAAAASPMVASSTRSSPTASPTAPAQPRDSSIARRSTASNSVPRTSAAAEQTATASTSPQSTELAAAASAVRQQAVTSPAAAASEGSFSAPSASTNVPSLTGSTASPQRASMTAPAVATSNAATTAGRSTSQTTPNLTTAASNVAQATTGSSSASSSAVAANSSSVSRQATSGASAAGATPASGGPQLAPATQVVSSSRAAASSAPTIDSAVAASTSPARSSRTSDLAASPANIDSPATAQANSGEAAPTPEASRTAMTRSLSGVSGVGQAANLDRALQAADSPSLVASGSARRAEATQATPEGAALAPSGPALVRHSLAGAERPSASILATTTGAATVAGSQQPAEVTASASGAVTRANANAAPGAVTADAGQVQVDLGPTRVVSEGGASRASGGGQPDLNPSAQAQQLARSSSGGTPQPTLASNTVAAEAAAPAGTGGGQPTPQGIAPMLADVGRGEPSPTEIGSGAAPSSQSEPADAPAASAAIAGGTPTRADGGPQMPEVAAAGGASGGEVSEDEEERARRLARQASGGAPQVAVRVELAPGMEAGSGGQPAGAEPTSGAEAADAQLARAESSGGAPSAGGAAGPTASEVTAGGGGALAGAVVVRRAEATDGFTGSPEPGGGTSSPSKLSPSRSFTANAISSVATVAGSPNSSGSPTGSPVDTPGLQAAELTGGRSGAPAAAAVGADAGKQMVDGVADSGTLAGVASQSRSASASDGPSVGTESSSAMAMRRATPGPVGPTSSVAATIDVPSAAPSATSLASADTGDLGVGSDLGPMSRQSTSSVPVDIDALEGAGGLGNRTAADVGLNNRRAREDSLQIQSRATRFVRQEVGGLPNFNTAAVVAADAFRGRSKPGDSPGSMGSSAGQQSDKAIELGLAYLARHQLADGSWNLQAVDDSAALVSDTAATGLALLAFQGYGYTHRDNEYAAVVKRGIDYLVQHQQDNGDLFIPLDDESNRSVWLYSHGIAALAMCEAYGMTQDPELKGPAQKAVDFIVASQHKEYGGWRYAPNLESDTSVTGWMMMALKSGDLANLNVPTETYARIEHWLDASQGSRSERHKYRYNPYAPDTESQAHGRDTSTTMTAVGLLMRFYAGWHRDNENMSRGADYLLQSPPAIGTARDPKRDTYYWYYATQVMFHMGGEHWKKWNDHLRPVLLDAQIQTGADAGSWNPRLPVADRWAPHAGRLYVTALNLLSLEVHYRHLPLYDETGR